MSGSRPDNVLTLGSLFSGIGGLEYGLEMTGRFKTVWQVEKDAYCRKVLAKHWPDVTRYEDVKDVGKENLSPVDVICGGFPCQDISHAGRQAGIVAGTRSGLWYEYVRIIRELRPRYVIVENVSALLALGLDVVLGELAESGYDAEWSMLSAEAVGAPHLRERIFILAHARQVRQHARRPEQPLPRPRMDGPTRQMADSQGNGRGSGRAWRLDSSRPRQSEQAFQNVADSAHACPRSSDGTRGWWSVEPDVGRVANGVPARVDRIAALGNAVVPQCAKVVGEWLLEIHDELTGTLQNQCDGCQRGLPVVDGIHCGEGYDMIGCTADRYGLGVA